MRSVPLLLCLCSAACLRSPRPLAIRNPAPAAESANDGIEWFLKTRIPPGATSIPWERYAAAREHIDRMPAFSIAGAGKDGARSITGRTWISVGSGNIGGRTRSWVIHPKNPDIMYAGAVTGGVWKTVDGGKSWTPLWDGMPVLAVGALAMDPSDPNILYAGTGEFSGFPGQGIFKSVDAGANWNLLPGTATFSYTNRLLISDKNPQRLYAATSTGVWTSTDAGATWRQSTINTSQASSGCRDMVMRTDTPTDYLFVSCYGVTPSPDFKIWRNTDAAGTGTWTVVFTTSNMRRTSLSLAPSRPSTIYAMSSSTGGDARFNSGLLAVFRSTSSGDLGSWETRVSNADPNPINTVLLSNPGPLFTTAYCNGGQLDKTATVGGQGDYDNVLAVDPLDPDRVWAGGVDLFRSDDGGANWGEAGRWQMGEPGLATPALGTYSATSPHADKHVILFHPAYDGVGNQTMFVGSDGGLIRTDNARAAVSTGPLGACAADAQRNIALKWTALNNSYATNQFYHGFAYPGGLAYMAGAQDNSVSRGADATGPNRWIRFSSGDGASVALDPADANVFLESKQRVAMSRSVDGGTTLGATTGITENANNFPFIAALAMDPHEGRNLFLGGATNLWRSVNGGANWVAAAPTPNNISAIAISPLDSGTVLFGTSAGSIYRSSSALISDGATAWSFVRPRNGNLVSLAFDPTNPNIVYASYSSFKSLASDAHVYRSRDGGQTWSASDGTGSSSVPDIPTHAILVDPLNPAGIYLASDQGLFVSPDAGVSWARDTNPFSRVVVDDLVVDRSPDSNWLFAFTYGRGAYKVKLPNSTLGDCTYTVSPAQVNVEAAGGVVPISVSAPPGCAWMGLPGIAPTSISIQSPAQGVGNGTAFVVVAPNFSGAALSDTVIVANRTVSGTQASAPVNTTSRDLSSDPSVVAVGSLSLIDTRSLTSDPDDPLHSCTNSRDFKSAWWSVTPTTPGVLQVRSWGRRFDVFGNSGIVVTGYRAGNLAQELACATVPRDTAAQIDAVIRFNVTAGITYLIEVSATGSASQDGGNTPLVLSMGTPDAVVSVSPATATLSAGSGNQRQFTAQVSGPANTAVRWSLTPSVGVISTTGLYTAPVSVAAATMVTVTATSFADPSKRATATITLAPAPKPAIDAGGIVNGATFQSGVVAGSWVTIRGSNFATTALDWSNSDFSGGKLPTTLGGVQVTFGGQLAAMYYVSPAQLNVQAPAVSGSVPVQVISNGVASNAVTVTIDQHAPGLFAYPAGGKLYPAAVFLDTVVVGDPAVVPGTRKVKPGDRILLFGTGIDPSAAGVVITSAVAAAEPVTVLVGSAQATVEFAGLVAVGEFQINIVVPNLADGDYPLVVRVAGQSSPSTVVLPIGR